MHHLRFGYLPKERISQIPGKHMTFTPFHYVDIVSHNDFSCPVVQEAKAVYPL